jgi:thiol-disulfide isomerase/thioredoxin
MRAKYFSGAWRMIFTATLCVAGLFSCTEKRPTVVETPVFDAWSTSTIEIEKIEMTDSATIFHFKAFFPHNQWIRIAKGTFIRESGTEEQLTVVKADSIDLDKEFYMPESGETAFVLYFPPLKPDITKIDFIECESEGCFNIWGIHLLPGEKANVASLKQKECTEALPALEYSAKPAKLSGKFFGYVPSLNKEVSIDYVNLSGEPQSVKTSVADDGTFSLEAPVGFPGVYYSSTGRVFLTPGQEVKRYIDLAKQMRKESRFRKDKEAGDSTYLFVEGDGFFLSTTNLRKAAANVVVPENSKDFYTEVFGKTPSEYKDFILKKYEEKLNDIKQSDGSETEKTLSEAFLKMSAIQNSMSYENVMYRGYALTHHITGRDWDTVTYKPEQPDYHASMDKVLFSDQIAYTYGFSRIVGMLKYLYLSADTKDKPVKEQFAAFKENANPIFGETSLIYDYMLAVLYGDRIKEAKFYTDADKEEIKAAFAEQPAYTETLFAENDKIKAQIEENKLIIKQVPNVAEDKVFDEILKLYEGKVVLVDFWATWCGPCLQSLKTMAPMKESWKDKNIVFVYLTGETSPLATWNKMIPDIHGEHYRVSNSQWAYWGKSIKIEGIPTYLIYDKKGKQVQRYTGYPGNEEMKKVIEPLF